MFLSEVLRVSVVEACSTFQSLWGCIGKCWSIPGSFCNLLTYLPPPPAPG